jgi:tetratricopeptide (TPR) repeat protein
MNVRNLRKIVALLTALCFLATFWTAAYAQHVDAKPAPKTKQAPTRAAILRALEEAAASSDALKDARSKATMLSTIATARAKIGDRVSAAALFKQAIQAADDVADPQQRAFALEEIAIAEAESNDPAAAIATVRRAFAVANDIRDDHQRNFTKMYLVRTYARAGDVDAALQVAGEFPSSSFYKARALSLILGGMNHGDPQTLKKFLPRVLEMVAAIPEPGTQATCLQGIAEELADAGDIAACETVTDILHNGAQQFGPQNGPGHNFVHSEALALSALAKAQAKVGRNQAAAKNFEKAVELAEQMPPEGEALRRGRLGQIARDRALAGDVDGAIRTAEPLKDAAPLDIAMAQAKAGRRERARLWFREAIQTANQTKSRNAAGGSASKPSQTLRPIAYAQARAGFTSDAIQTANMIDDPKSKDGALALIAATMAKQGETKPALRLVERIHDEAAKSQALRDVAEGQTHAGDFRGAVEWAKSLSTPAARANAFLGIARAIVSSAATTQ